MCVVPVIGDGNQPPVEPALVRSALVATHQKNGLPGGIEGEGHTPDLPMPFEPQFFHVGVSRTLEGVDSRPAQVGPELRQQMGMCQHFILQVFSQQAQLVVEVVVEDDGPAHRQIMASGAYGVKCIPGSRVMCRRLRTVLPKWIAAMNRGDEVFINGDGSTSCDFCFVADEVQANLRAALADDAARDQVCNVAVGGVRAAGDDEGGGGVGDALVFGAAGVSRMLAEVVSANGWGHERGKLGRLDTH